MFPVPGIYFVAQGCLMVVSVIFLVFILWMQHGCQSIYHHVQIPRSMKVVKNIVRKEGRRKKQHLNQENRLSLKFLTKFYLHLIGQNSAMCPLLGNGIWESRFLALYGKRKAKEERVGTILNKQNYKSATDQTRVCAT